MIRNVLLLRFKPDATPEQIAAFERSMKAIRFDGCTRWDMDPDLGLRDGNASHVIVADFEDESAYRAYDANAEHNRIRREVLAPILDRVERIQYRA